MTDSRHDPKTGLRPARRGFTLIELLVVVVIVILVSAVTLPTVIPALTNRQVGEASRILQAAFAGSRDAAIRANAPRGFRLLPDPVINGTTSGGRFASNRFVPIEPAPALIDGLVTFPTRQAEWVGATGGDPPVFPFPVRDVNGNLLPNNAATKGNYPFPLDGTNPEPSQNIFGTFTNRHVLMVVEARFEDNRGFIPNQFTNWFWNVRVGDKIRVGDSGALYTVVGPMTQYNPENYVNIGPPGTAPALRDVNIRVNGTTQTVEPEFLFLVNGVDDNSDGYVDQGIDGVDQDVTGVPDNLQEWVAPNGSVWTSEKEEWLSTSYKQAWDYARAYPRPPAPPLIPAVEAQEPPRTFPYTIYRRPVVSPGARDVNLPAGAVIDMTTWNSTRERSRLPIDPLSGHVDVLINPSGTLVPTTQYSSPSSFSMDNAFFHFWIADRDDVVDPFDANPATATYPNLPVPEGTQNYSRSTFLKKDRNLLTLFTNTGQVVTNSVENFDLSDKNAPYYDAQLGIREAK